VGRDAGVSVRPFTLLVTRSVTERARLVVFADNRDEAEELGRARAEGDDVLWEDGERDLTVETEGRNS
jgi:hypothetical protein